MVDPEGPDTCSTCAPCRPTRRRSWRAHAGVSRVPARSRSTAASRPVASTTSSTARAIRASWASAWPARGISSAFFKHATAAQGNPMPGLRLRHGMGRLADRPISSSLRLRGLQRRRTGAHRLRRRVRSSRRRRARIVQPPLRPAIARPAPALQHPVSRGHVPVHRRGPDGSGHAPDRRAAGARAAQPHRAEDVPPVDQLGVLQPGRIADAHRRHGHPRHRAAPDEPHLHGRRPLRTSWARFRQRRSPTRTSSARPT